mmetsp:Transcript_70727/g.218422  ORF Transcript_70727/g.218422 Transcript_70727/m.218422 type:complete len:186 (+) Transcript_70727:77-634(+)|eukprot:CAMPEP_0175641272 /NCGR_PEP_ID=MMETSP0097-20121207/4673_1 /TAXON_ID=311494 /ORGANISM="Alexandrium monilatum, Strain CCMP3105" /LENGTH=185 /DNA_ID=CAMNT_0016947039 /DNA_START=97 /DNA_END=654 /DNA_ORIENTATION=-
MLLPLPAFQISPGPPSQFLLDRKKWILAILILQSAVCILRFALLDIWAGFIVAIIAGVGWYGWYQNVGMTFICYWGMMGLIHGIFGLVRLIDIEVKSRNPMFSKGLPLSYNLNAAALLMEPIAMILGSLLAWYLYRYDVPDPAYERLNSSDWHGSSSRTRPSGGPSSGPRQGFATFSGEGHRLGS